MRRNPSKVSTKQERIARLAEQSPDMGFTSLAYMMDIEWLEEAYHRTRKTGAAGVDGQTAAEYEQDLRGNLQRLLNAAKSGRYFAPPVRRAHIPKPGSVTETRAIGIPTLEDKILQRAVVMLLEPIYEHDFHDGSYGFRPGRSAHEGLESLWQGLMNMGGGWVLEVDIRKFFDTLDHTHLREFLRRRVRDGVLLRLIGKWLKAGVMEDGSISYPESGSPQGGVISPLLANVYLHYVLDMWFEQAVKPHLVGRSFLIRYADDLVLAFSNKLAARQTMNVLPERFREYGLTLHPDKTRLVELRPPVSGNKSSELPDTFNFLGFTHYWAQSRKGRWVVKRKTESRRLSRAARAINQWCRQNRHKPVREQHQTLSRKLRGHCAYFGITGNSLSLAAFRWRMHRIWQYWLSRRNRKRQMTWERFQKLLERYPLPAALAIHSVCRPREAKP